jgi:alpha-glucosidase
MKLFSRLSQWIKQKLVSNLLQPLMNGRRVPRRWLYVRGFNGFSLNRERTECAIDCLNARITLCCLSPGIWRVMVNGPGQGVDTGRDAGTAGAAHDGGPSDVPGTAGPAGAAHAAGRSDAAGADAAPSYPRNPYLTWSTVLTEASALRVTKQGEHMLRIQSRGARKGAPAKNAPSKQSSIPEVFFDTRTATLEFRHDGRVLHTDRRAPAFRGQWVGCEKQAPEPEYYCGFGEKAGGMFKNGNRLVMWNTDNSDMTPGSDPLWQSCPLQIAVRKNGFAHALFFDNPHFCRFSLPKAGGPAHDPKHRTRTPLRQTAPRITSYAAERGPLCYYVIPGPLLKDVLRNFTLLCGRYPLPPRWVLGHHHSRWEERESAERLLAIARGFRERGIPCDTLHIDIGHMRGYRSFTWDTARFPDPSAAVKALHKDRFKVVIMSDPGLKRDPEWEVYTQGAKRGFFCTKADGAVFHAPVWPGNAAFPDFTSKQVREWWGSLYTAYVKHGIDGFWIDMNEPSLFTPLRTMPGGIQHAAPKKGPALPHSTVHNCYGLLMAEAAFGGLTRLRKGKRNFLFTRAAFAGIQRYASSWTGDNKSRWDHLRLSVPMLLNMGLSGQALVGPDIGGFWGKPTPELFLRWMQLGAFYPFCRNHSSNGTPPREIWCFPEDIQRLCVEALNLRYRLLPYFYTYLRQACEEGIPLMRPLFLEFPHDPACLEEETAAGQFMVGPDLMVCPVMEAGRRQRSVYLPAGNDWLAWPESTPHKGGARIIVETPPETLPLFVRAGAVIPCSPPVQVSEDIEKQTPELMVFPAAALHGSWYIDDGESLDYGNGGFSALSMEGGFEKKMLRLRVKRTGGTLAPPLGGVKELFIRVCLQGMPSPVRRITAGGKRLPAESRRMPGNWCELTLTKPTLPLSVDFHF